MMKNLILATDSYKCSHWKMFPKEVTGLYAYIESRGGKYPEVLFFGLQYAIRKFLSTPITESDVIEAECFMKNHGVPFNKAGWMRVVDVYGGMIPVIISAVPEGTLVPVGVPMVTVTCTDPKLYWLATYIETFLLRAVWYGSTVATNSFMCKRVIKQYLDETGDVSGLGFKLHDFGARGVSSQESAMIGGAAHLVNFLGSDTIEGVWCANKYYSDSMAGFSIPALEHSVTTSWGPAREVKCFENALEVYGGEGKLLACVSDTYDIFHAVEVIWGTLLKDKVIESGTTVVIRPDSGDPVFVVSKVMRILGEKFGYTINSKGYKVLNNVRVIQGDGVNIHSIESILKSLKNDGFSADNIAFGMGGALLQQLDRDTQRFAMKASAVKVGDNWIGISKDPVTDPGKASKAGRVIAAIGKDGKLECSTLEKNTSFMDVVYFYGDISNTASLTTIRARAAAYL